MCTALDGLKQVKATTVRVWGLVEQQVEQDWVVAAFDDDGEQVGCVLAHEHAPA